MTLKQSQLIKISIELFGLKDANPMSAPNVKPSLGKNADGKDRYSDGFH